MKKDVKPHQYRHSRTGNIYDTGIREINMYNLRDNLNIIKYIFRIVVYNFNINIPTRNLNNVQRIWSPKI